MTSMFISRRSLLRTHALCMPAIVLAACATERSSLSGGQKYSDRPIMMAIGDSLFQGVRSLTMAKDMIALAPPTQIASAIGAKSFVAPDYPFEIGWNAEDIMRNPFPLVFESFQFSSNLMANLIRWNHLGSFRPYEYWSRHEAFDNIAVGGASIEDLWLQTAEKADARLMEKLTKVPPGGSAVISAFDAPPVQGPGRPFLFNEFVEIWSDLNTSLTLNPRRRDEQRGKSQLRQALDRKPSILLINIGSNNGLFKACFTGAVAPGAMDSGQYFNRDEYLGQIDHLFGSLQGMPNDAKIVFNSLVRPRTVPNLMPAESERIAKPGGYYSAYGPSLFSGGPSVTGKQLENYDHFIEQLNGDVLAKMQQRLGSRGTFVDFYKASSELDSKHFPGREVTSHGHLLTNTPLEFGPDGRLAEGGMTGLDNMHPTGPGYAVYANTILAAMGWQGRKVDLNSAFAEDKLLTNPPGSIRRRRKEIRGLVQLAGVLGRFM